MRSRVARLTIGMLAWIVFGSVAFFLLQLDQQATERQAAWRTFDRDALEAIGALADVRFAQQAYLAQGQDVAFWTPRVAMLAATASREIEQLRQLATNARSPVTLSEAIAQIKAFDAIDQRARQYLLAGQAVMAGDLVISEGGQASRAAARLVERARLEEEQAVEALAADVRRQQMFALSAAGLVGVLTIALLVFLPAGPARVADADAQSLSMSGEPTTSDPVDELRLADNRLAVPAAPPAAVEDPVRALSAAAEICTSLGRSADLTELTGLLGRSAGLMGATGVIVWIGETPGGDLRPVMAYGYSEEVLARMPTIPRAAENAAAAAYRTGMLQVVRAPSKTSPGAIVAPLLSSEGCVGALTAEIAGHELSESAQALAMLFAAHLTSILVPPATVASDVTRERVASA